MNNFVFIHGDMSVLLFCSDELAQSVVSKNSEPGVDSQFWLKSDVVKGEKKEKQCQFEYVCLYVCSQHVYFIQFPL